ncbi:GNAT family N-acetyltransferase [Mucilaginibacter ginsenosidivorax]|uniref:GNAT family N-acetyltransferase n=1 Tax=Mucilaginibacter ginsenosidivorax TaxID=862126 RepID=A0A5B8VZR6_9SPHI|nr:N-acetyltransferase [Mucilaginibacter ginsenosidivorax]QEC76122.1 GNAT family N-acetyltransferase [Mucilaginibacter ginsenosidivorax]
MIREARNTDALTLSQLIVLAMGELAPKFVNGRDESEAGSLFELFAGKTGNQYSYENALVYEDETGICGMILGYDGAKLATLREPFLQHIKTTYNFEQPVEDETEPGEYYIDCLSVFPGHQGKGIGKKLIKAFIEYAADKGYFTTGLLVSKNNPGAKSMYTSLDFKVVDERLFVGDMYEHLQYKIKPEA